MDLELRYINLTADPSGETKREKGKSINNQYQKCNKKHHHRCCKYKEDKEVFLTNLCDRYFCLCLKFSTIKSLNFQLIASSGLDIYYSFNTRDGPVLHLRKDGLREVRCLTHDLSVIAWI